MNRMRTIAPVLISLVLASSLVSPALDASAHPEAITVTTTAHLAIAKTVINPGTNETISFADAEAVFRVSFAASGGTQVDVTGYMHGTSKGQASGTAYEFSGGGKAKISADRPPLSEFILICNGNLIIRDTGSSQPIVIVTSLTVNAAGQVSATVRDVKIHPQ